jgi:hypothetical protein
MGLAGGWIIVERFGTINLPSRLGAEMSLQTT